MVWDSIFLDVVVVFFTNVRTQLWTIVFIFKTIPNTIEKALVHIRVRFGELNLLACNSMYVRELLSRLQYCIDHIHNL